MKQQVFTILGGGIAGLACAIALARTGHAVTVLEKAKVFDPIGAGIQLGPNAVRALQKIGAWDAVHPITYSPPALCFRSGTSGRILKQIQLGSAFEKRFGQPYRVAHRADLHASLLQVAQSLAGIEIRMGATAALAAGSGPVIAADGIWSSTRQSIFPGTAAIIDENLLFRAMTPMPQNASINFECVNFWYYPGAHVVHYPAGRAGKLNMVVSSPKIGPRTHFAKAARLLAELIERVPAWTEWTAAYVTPLPVWHQGNILLVGDAAHGTLPFVAQGAAMSLEDAAALMASPVPAEFEAHRVARCTKLHEQTLRTGRIYHLAGFRALARNAVLRFSSDETVLGRMAWIYNG